jgi:hypothetical protein
MTTFAALAVMLLTIPRRDASSPITSPVFPSGTTTSTSVIGSRSSGPAARTAL